MRVRKFEAKSMKEALQMVKLELGPDAVILSARDNRKRFGLAGEGSIEVTAAVAENTYQKKRYTESRMREVDRKKFSDSTARTQKQVIERSVERRLAASAPPPPPRPRTITTTSYIDIKDEEPSIASIAYEASRPVARSNTKAAAPVASSSDSLSDQALKRIRSAARDAWKAGLSTAEEPKVVTPKPSPKQATAPPAPEAVTSNTEITSLKNEIARLQKLMERFQTVPQNFVHPHPGAEHGLSYELSGMYQKLIEAGINVENTVDILQAAQKEMPPAQIKKTALVEAWVARWFLNNVQTVAQPSHGRLHLFVGGAGSGKTSTLVKMASHLVVNEQKRIAIVTTDSLKVGAVDQLKIYCQILNVPFAIIRNKSDWDWVLSQLHNVDHILADLPGLQLRDLEEIQMLKSFLPPETTGAICHMVVPATAKDGDVAEICRRYRVANCQDLIFTQLDQSVQHGVIYNLHRRTKLPLHSFGIGNRIPEDFEVATKERVLDLIFKLSKIKREQPK